MKAFILENVNKFKILNIIRMSIKAIMLLDICMTDRKTFTYNAWNLIDSNGLCNEYNWPRKPEQFTMAQIGIWQRALQKTFGRSYTNQANREIHPEFILQE